MYFFVSVDECIFLFRSMNVSFCSGRWMYFLFRSMNVFFLIRSMNVFFCFGRWMYLFLFRSMNVFLVWMICLFRSMNVFFLDPAEPDFTYTNFLDPPEPDFTYTNFFEPHRTRVYLHKLFWNPPNLILPTQTFWDHPEPDFTYTNSFGTPNRISPTLFFHIIRELFIALFFSQTPLVALGCTTSKII